MPLSASPVATSRDTVIPDCCNIGVVFRALLAVNAAMFFGILMRAGGLQQAVLEFVEVSVLVELACLWSLFALCGLRKTLVFVGTSHPIPPAAQRALCALVPAVMTGIVVHFLTSFDWFASSFAHLTELKGMLAAAIFGICLQHYFELRTRAFSPALVEARLQALQARIRPHFLFNSLNAVLSLIRTEPKRAENTLEDLADLFRVLMSDPHAMTTMAKEIQLCQQYLSIEKIRLGERLQLQWNMQDIEEDVLRKAQVPILLLQPLLENAVHYGVEPASGPVTVQVQVSRAIDRIEVMIVNPYHGSAVAQNGNHIALNNIRERLALLYDVEAQLTTTIAQGMFEVRLRFPYTKSPV